MARVDYKRGGCVHLSLSSCADTTEHIPRVGPEDIVHKDLKWNIDKSLMLHQDPKSVPSRQQLVGKYTNPGNNVLDQLAGSYSTAYSCMLLPLHRRCVGLESHSACKKYGPLEILHVHELETLCLDLRQSKIPFAGL